MCAVSTKSIPTTLLTGFLGAGKTTYLNQLLHEGVPANSLVVVNDFGKINIDADLIDYQDEHIIRLNNGCVCCTLGGSMAEKLAEISHLMPPPAALYIETSGVADAARVADMIRVSTRFNLIDVWCFVDVSLAEQHRADPRVKDVWQKQIASASQLVLNRLATKADIPWVLDQQLKAKKGSAIVHYDYQEGTSRVATAPPPKTAVKESGVGGWYSFSIESKTPVDISQLQALLQKASGLYRAKGVVMDSETGRMMVLQYTKNQCRWLPSKRSATTAQLVFIGEQASLKQLQEQLQSLYLEQG